jgi:hypothetical protein
MEYENNQRTEKQLKQKYLREQILENGWKGDDFANYLANLRTDGLLTRRRYRPVGLRRACERGGAIQNSDARTQQ